MALTDKAANPRRPKWVVWIETLIKKELKEIKRTMANMTDILAKTKADVERLIQFAIKTSAAVADLKVQNQSLADSNKALTDQVAVLTAQIAAGGGDPALVAELQAQIADQKTQIAAQATGLQSLDDEVNQVVPDTPVVPPVDPGTGGGAPPPDVVP